MPWSICELCVYVPTIFAELHEGHSKEHEQHEDKCLQQGRPERQEAIAGCVPSSCRGWVRSSCLAHELDVRADQGRIDRAHALVCSAHAFYKLNQHLYHTAIQEQLKDALVTCLECQDTRDQHVALDEEEAEDSDEEDPDQQKDLLAVIEKLQEEEKFAQLGDTIPDLTEEEALQLQRKTCPAADELREHLKELAHIAENPGSRALKHC